MGEVSERMEQGSEQVVAAAVAVAKVQAASDMAAESEAGTELGTMPVEPGSGRVLILIENPTHRRLVEAASMHLALNPVPLTEQEALDRKQLDQVELIVADDEVIRRIRARIKEHQGNSDAVEAALVAVAQPGAPPAHEGEFEGVLILPQEPAVLVAQLGLMLYAHPAFARRFRSALEELNLNRRIFRSVTSGISIASAREQDLPLVYVNPAFEVMTGYSFEEVQGRNCRFLQGVEHGQPGVTLIREAIVAEREVTVVIKNYRKNGSTFWNEFSLSPIRDRNGELTHFVGIQMDVTARVEFENKLRESEKLAAVGRLAASIAHEINNPLESVMNLLYLARTSEGEEMRGYLTQADRELQRVSHITAQSLRFYRQSTKPQAVRCTDLLEGVLELYQGRLDTASITVERRERTTQSIVCLESEIRQVLSNLIRNALDAMHGHGGGRLLVRTRESTEWRTKTRGVMLTIADTGTGISPETMHKLYTAFFTTKDIGGTGLGLWVSAEIIKRHRGRMRVRSRVAEGDRGGWTVFALFLPYQTLAE